MDASGFDKLGCQPSDARRRRAAVARLLRMGVSDGAKSSSDEMAAMSELETELALLREENARLKVERHRPTDAGHVIERMRALTQEASTAEPDAGSPSSVDGGQAFAECLALREGLMHACQEAQQAMQMIRGRLEALTDGIDGRAGDRGMPWRLAGRPGEAAGAERDGSDGDSSEFAQSVA